MEGVGTIVTQMYFDKIENPANFTFGNARRVAVERKITSLGEDVFAITYSSKLWRSNDSIATLDPGTFKRAGKGTARVEPIDSDGFSMIVGSTVALSTDTGGAFGLCGRKWVVTLAWNSAMRFYGLGEKCGGLEKTGVRTKFWNTDVFADFDRGAILRGETDPMYVSIPYLLIRTEAGYAGLLVDNPHAVFMNLGATEGVEGQKELGTHREVYFGALDGKPEMYVIYGPSPLDVTAKLQRLCGATPRPPMWALGHHQCRWGYESYDDLEAVRKKFEERRIPNDGLWIDIEYMRGYRVFTFEKKNFANPKKQIGALTAGGSHVCPILDPGVKLDDGYSVYREGIASDVFCRNREGKPFVGFVWPGRTVFPDFSTKRAREWWASNVKELASTGISGAWVDMNDPSTGSADPEEMLFGEGRNVHTSFHNQYALGMQMATRDGFLAANPGSRPFIISRSGYISTSRFSAIWTGDNVSSYTYLALSIPMCLNLALSGVPFVGSDVGGFGGDCTPSLLVDWYKAAFLFPFFRNHSIRGSRRQEPWAMGVRAGNIIRSYIRARYRMLPYLYNLFVRQEADGAPILRPLFFDFEPDHRFEATEDQFMVGEAILQAPFVTEHEERRKVLLPRGYWFDPVASAWVRGGRSITVDRDIATTPLYFREGTIVPMQPKEPESNAIDPSRVEFHVFLRAGSRATARYRYVFDDGASFDYREKGSQSVVDVAASVEGDTLVVTVSTRSAAFGSLDAAFVVYDSFKAVRLTRGDGGGVGGSDGARAGGGDMAARGVAGPRRGRVADPSAAPTVLPLKKYSWSCCGTRVSARRTPESRG